MFSAFSYCLMLSNSFLKLLISKFWEIDSDWLLGLFLSLRMWTEGMCLDKMGRSGLLL